MKVLLVSSTAMEIEPFQQWINRSKYVKDCHFLITGPGILFTTYTLGQVLNQNVYDLVLGIGIAGSFIKSYPNGSVFQISQEEFADFGAMDHEEFLDIFKLGLVSSNEFPFSEGKLINPLKIPGLPFVSGITVNCASGDEKTISRLRKRYNPAIETLEGASLFYICLLKKVPFLEIRAISNKVEPRNRKAWNIPIAIQNLNQSLIELFPKIYNQINDSSQT
jgi:futalosine hydrolase